MSESVPPLATEEAQPRSWNCLIVVVLSTCLAICAGWFAWRIWLGESPRLPTVDLRNADDALVELIKKAEDGVRSDPRSPDTWGRLGMVLLAHDYYPEASACFIEAQKREQLSGRWLYLEAQARSKIDPLAAIRLLEEAINRDSEDATFRVALGELLLEQGRLDDAERHFKQALGHDLLRPWSQLRMAQAALRRGNFPVARNLAKIAASRLDDVKVVHAVLSEINFRLGDLDASEREYQRSLSLATRKWHDPYLESVDRLKTSALPQVEQASQDIAALLAIAEAHPKSVPARLSLAFALGNRQNWEGAAHAARKALQISPNDAVALNVLGFALRKQGRVDDALAVYMKSTEANPNNAATHYELANCYNVLRQKDKAVDALKTAVRLRPNYATAWRELGQFYARDNNAEAVTCFRLAVELAPNDAEARKLLDAALKRFEKASPSPVE